MVRSVIAQGITIQEAAARTRLSAHTLRYYERIGLIHEVRRGTGGRRRYDADDLAGWSSSPGSALAIRDMCRYGALPGGRTRQQ